MDDDFLKVSGFVGNEELPVSDKTADFEEDDSNSLGRLAPPQERRPKSRARVRRFLPWTEAEIVALYRRVWGRNWYDEKIIALALARNNRGERMVA